MDSKPVLTYFGVNARGGYCRAALSYAKVDFVDEHVTYEQWAEKKKTFPVKKLPALAVGGKTYWQSLAVLTFIAEEYKIGNTDPHSRTLNTCYLLNIENLIQKLFDCVYFIKDLEERAKARETFVKKELPEFLDFFEAELAKNGTDLLTGSVVSTSDITLCCYLYEVLDDKVFDSIDKWERVSAHYKVMKEVHLKEFFEKYNIPLSKYTIIYLP